MTWKPSKIELELIADAGHPVDKIAFALGITEAEFRAWSASLVATRSAPRAAPPIVAPPSEPVRSRVLADRLFEAQPDAHIDDLADEN